MIVKSIKIQNFKGIRKREIEFSENPFVIAGENGAGKTSIYSALMWCLFDKDSSYRSKFEVKNNKTDEMAEVIVEVSTDLGTFKRKLYKKQRKKTENGKKVEYLKNEYDYYFNDTFIDATPYYKKVNEIINSEQLMKILTSVYYFCEHMPWKQRRNFLVDMFGSLSKEDILKDFPSLQKALEDVTPEMYKKSLRTELSDLEKDKKEIPVKINEAEDNIVEVKETEEELNKSLKTLEEQKDNLKKLFDSDNKARMFDEKISKLELELKEAEIEHEKSGTVEWSDKIEKLHNELSDSRKQLDELNQEISSVKKKKEALEEKKGKAISKIEMNDARIKQLREEFLKVKNEKETADFICSECGQEYPEEKKTEIKESLIAKKSARLSKINEEGKSLRAENEKLASEIEAIQKELNDLKDVSESEKRKSDVESEITGIRREIDLVQNRKNEEKTESAKVKKIQEKIEQQKKFKADMLADKAESRKQTERDIAEVDEKIKSVYDILSKIKQNERQREKIKTFNKQKKEVKKRISDINSTMYELELFESALLSANEEIINKNFEKVKFKMFQRLENGGIQEICEATVDDVEYNSNLNTGAKIHAGIEIIQVLSKMMNVSFPLFIDNAEALTEIPDFSGQMILLKAISNKEKENIKL